MFELSFFICFSCKEISEVVNVVYNIKFVSTKDCFKL